LYLKVEAAYLSDWGYEIVAAQLSVTTSRFK